MHVVWYCPRVFLGNQRWRHLQSAKTNKLFVSAAGRLLFIITIWQHYKLQNIGRKGQKIAYRKLKI